MIDKISGINLEYNGNAIVISGLNDKTKTLEKLSLNFNQLLDFAISEEDFYDHLNFIIKKWSHNHVFSESLYSKIFQDISDNIFWGQNYKNYFLKIEKSVGDIIFLDKEQYNPSCLGLILGIDNDIAHLATVSTKELHSFIKNPQHKLEITNKLVDFSNNLKYQNLYNEEKHHQDLDSLILIIREHFNNLSTNVFTNFVYNLAAK